MTAVAPSDHDHRLADIAPPPARVAIIGGGLAGLAAAFAIVRRHSGVRVTLIERDGRLGGKVLTERLDDFIVEAGPDSFLSSKPRGIGLATELGLRDSLRGPTPRPNRAYVLSRGALHKLPEGLSGLVPTRIGPVFASSLLSPRGKARFAGDFVLPARRDPSDEPLASFVRRRLGSDAYDRLVEPLMAGIYAGDGERLSLAATFPQLRAAELAHGSLIRGVLAARKPTHTPEPAARPAFLTPAGGLGDVVTALTDRLVAAGTEILIGAAASTVRRAEVAGSGAYLIPFEDGRTVEADAVVLAVPAFVAGDLLNELDPILASELRGIPHASTSLVSLAYPRTAIEHPLDGHGYLIPRIERRPALAVTWVSEKWAGRAPSGYALLRVFLGRFGQEEALAGDDRDLVALARAEVEATLGISGEPVLRLVQRWPWGMPQYVLGHPDRLARIEQAVARLPGLALAGNAYRGVGIPDVIASGEAAAEAVLNAVAGPVAAASLTAAVGDRG